MPTAPIDYSKYLFKGGPTGVYSLVGGTARPISDVSSIDPSIVSNLQSKEFGVDTSGYDPQHGGGSTGGAVSFNAIAPNIYAMDPNYRNQVDQANVAANPNINQMPATKPIISQDLGASGASSTSSSPSYYRDAQGNWQEGTAANQGYSTVDAALKAPVQMPKATEAPLASPQAGYIKAYDSNNGYKEVYVKPGQYYPGISLYPKPSGSITPEVMQNETTIKVPGATDTGLGEANAMVAGGNTTLSQIISQLTPPQTEADRKQQTLLDQMASLVGEQGNQARDQLTEEESARIPQLRQQFAEINGEIQTKMAEYNSLLTKNQDRAVTMNSIIGSERSIINARAADIGLLQARANALQGNIQAAQETVDRAIGLKYSTLQSKLDIYKAQLEALQPELNREEKLQAQAQQILLQQRQEQLDAAKSQDKQIQSLMLDAASNGASNSILSAISGSKTLTQAAQAYSSFINERQAMSLMKATGSSGSGSSSGGSGNGTNTEPTLDPNVQGWVDLINSGRAGIINVPANLKTKVAGALSKTTAPVASKSQEEAKGRVALIDQILTSPGLSGAVGPNLLSRFRPIASLTGSTADFLGKVRQLTSQETLDTLLNLKKSGGTLGALSDQERIMLQDAATSINSWALRDDKGNIYAYKVSEKTFKDELNRLKGLAQKAITNAGSSAGSSNLNSQTMSDGTQWVQNEDGTFSQL